ncbi:restriction endonuclease subunit S [Vibrio lentus]|uniref:restriction endonuclease subunit S n=1 Tax=Vibrio lentus TaxID=136468 RepID=UPI000C83AFEC|nr:restriction endonuclease subunit S [Vibrio lentus]
MSCNWVTRKLDNLISIKHGFAFKGEFFTDKETYDYLVTPGNFAIGGGFKGDKFKYYNGPVPDDYILEVGALVVTMTDLSKQADTLGYSALIPEIEGHRILHNQRVGLVENISNEIDKEFLYFLLRSKEYRHHVVSGATGTTVKHTSPTKILSYEFQLPPLDIQREIAKNLIALEKKITVNFDTNEILEEMAQAIFKSWFVNFDPVKAKMNGGQPEGMDAATASLFPEKLVESELGLIPEGWAVGALSDLMDFNPKRTLKKGTIAPYLDMKNMPTSGHLALEIYDREMGSGTKFMNGDSLLARITPCLENGKSAYVDFLKDDQVGWGSTEYIVMRSKSDSYKYFSYYMARFEPFRKFAIQSMTGTSGRQRAQAKTVETMPFAIPPKSILESFDELIGAHMKLIRRYGDESKTLAQLRDTLLPKLLSGEVVFDAALKGDK